MGVNLCEIRTKRSAYVKKYIAISYLAQLVKLGITDENKTE